MDDQRTNAADGGARLDFHKAVADLLEHLGRTSVAYIAGSRSRAIVARWAAPPGDSAHAEPSYDEARRLEAAHSALRSIEDADNDGVARSWLLSANPRLDGATPVEVIRNGDYLAVARAVEAFVNDTYHS
ncbi:MULTISPECIES: antitoxin Xre/MbcA/ParS toxin-binding domain-containing protein [Mycobacterium avium complex (MAC)]|uniref:antitoxin Xre/MbcA/ParS toxin-binding domain-containing protein n=1 Tax=Mycobacterium avium complex (MAC) TaxID=120793 RepID=UPI0004495BBF|nr:antitoxin Xre/MbcA/ParS toxin-binding domain-containing protein [Mycobacterium intracellulare]ETZ39859.1 hypothetical protein L843_0148 [Mycobacterium intracellulare MIN_061107_1834]MCA2275243.1 DUF2384 domain-containing protein [Mycobacterium intracellulare]UEB24855.1 DUF2384 domain-containing protein [Mycobacterium intracellulare]BCO60129.1 hypothetical protein MINTM006_00790 [Mycobacterium intracellulare]BCO70746.1 hypothetical protein MINTM008_00810 [Mycobacterium intracellulare]